MKSWVVVYACVLVFSCFVAVSVATALDGAVQRIEAAMHEADRALNRSH